ncbi:DUF58 domain-containing protein [Natribaculum luteum]|uniref:DUF58 domain-containing protein n=1 Tax=Natribaculum luteum TaxID=1586232 RepID=A0ABD5P0Z8_9EURY|nr:DUF58 domain-containing protein [Natribaculum luteum]
MNVKITVTNTGTRVISDLRIIDGVPPELGINSGSPRAGMLLQPGESETFEYTVTARQGTYEFRPITTISYIPSGTVARRDDHNIETILKCKRPINTRPPGTQTSKLVGQVLTESGGSGAAFHSVREYRSSDTLNRINWRRYAQTGELSTVKYHQEKAATIHLLIDTRSIAFRQASVEQPTAVELSVYAAEQHFAVLSDANHHVGVGFYSHDVLAVAPASGTDHTVKAKAAFEEHEALQPIKPAITDRQNSTPDNADPTDNPFVTDSVRPDFEIWDKTKTDEIRTLLSSLPDYGQCIVFTPLLDDEPGSLVKTLSAHGYGVSVVSPDITDRESPGAKMSSQHRQIRIRTLREESVAVVDWDTSDPLSAALMEDL